jgi:hypothetical protein
VLVLLLLQAVPPQLLLLRRGLPGLVPLLLLPLLGLLLLLLGLLLLLLGLLLPLLGLLLPLELMRSHQKTQTRGERRRQKSFRSRCCCYGRWS